MKTPSLLLTGAMALVPLLSNAQQHVWRVNNQGYSADFTGPTALQDAAEDGDVLPGDTLHLEPSPVSYGDLYLSKKLVIIGPGYRLGQGTMNNDSLQANNGMTFVHSIGFNAGSDTSTVTGVVIGDGTGNGGIAVGNANRITLDRNFHWGRSIFFNGSGINGFTITRCYFEAAGITTPGNSQVVSDVVIANNYFSGGIFMDGTFSNVLIANNVLNYNAQHIPYGAVVKNNIFVLGSVAVNNNSIVNNAATGANTLPPDNGNVNNVVFDNVFDEDFTSDDLKWHLAPNYQIYMDLIGDDDTEPGMFGGNTPYKPSGIPAIPAIYQLAAPATAIQGDPIQVTIGTRSND